MPPTKETCKTKLFIAPCGTEDWKEIEVEIPIKIITDDMPPTPNSINVRITCEWPNTTDLLERMEKLIASRGHKKKRKTTYKTIRHDCAKRNGRR